MAGEPSMVERVARAINPSAFQYHDGGVRSSWVRADVEAAYRASRAAIQAMREPTPKMLKAIRTGLFTSAHLYSEMDQERFELGYRRGIEAALATEEAGG